MAMKRLLTPEEHAKLAPAFQSEYKEQDGAFVLDLTDYEDPAVLKRAKDHERDLAKGYLAKLKAAEDSLLVLTTERDDLLKNGVPKDNMARIEKSWADKLTKREGELTAEIAAANSTLQTLLVDNVATSLASEISTAPAVLLPHIKSRLTAEKGADGKFSTRVLDKDGKPSALTVEELRQEFVLNKDFAQVITGSKASGGGANGAKGGSGAPLKLDFSKSSPKDIAASLRAAGKAPAVPAAS